MHINKVTPEINIIVKVQPVVSDGLLEMNKFWENFWRRRNIQSFVQSDKGRFLFC